MSISVIEEPGDVKIFGSGSPGGKGAGLIQVNKISIPRVAKLKTRVMATSFYDGFLRSGRVLEDEALSVVASILEEFGTCLSASVRPRPTRPSRRRAAGAGACTRERTRPSCCPTTIPIPESGSAMPGSDRTYLRGFPPAAGLFGRGRKWPSSSTPFTGFRRHLRRAMLLSLYFGRGEFLLSPCPENPESQGRLREDRLRARLRRRSRRFPRDLHGHDPESPPSSAPRSGPASSTSTPWT